jgi:hypothetical protein
LARRSLEDAMEYMPIPGTQRHRQSPDMPLSHDLATDKLRAGHIAAMALALVAGFVDAYGYLGWHVFGAGTRFLSFGR